MLKEIIDIVNNSNSRIENGTLFCDNFIVTDISCIEFLQSKNALENTLDTIRLGYKINLELSLAHLNSLGFYEDCETFILKNKYSNPPSLYYLYDLKCFSSEPNDFFDKYNCIIELINSIKKNAKHTYNDSEITYSIIFKEDQSLFLPIIYNATDVTSLRSEDIDILNSTSKIFEDINDEKKLIFINELVIQLNAIEEDRRFKFLLSDFADFYAKCINAYQFYLRDFSYNKLKLELDTKALDYTQRIQSVINDSQTKLIAIPTAFVLVAATFDFEEIVSVKNIASIISLYIFALLIQLFLNNQKSTLNFIQENIFLYKKTFKDHCCPIKI